MRGEGARCARACLTLSLTLSPTLTPALTLTLAPALTLTLTPALTLPGVHVHAVHPSPVNSRFSKGGGNDITLRKVSAPRTNP